MVFLAMGGCADLEVGTSSAPATVAWTNAVGVSAAGNDLSKTDPTDAWNAGAVSAGSIASDGYVEFTTGENTTAKMAGLSQGDSGQRHSDIDFAVHLKANGRFGVYQGGVLIGSNFGTYLPGDLFRVENAAGVVTYSRNGDVFHSSSASPGAPLLLDTSLRTPGATIQDAVMVSTMVTWQDAVGVSTSGNDLTKTALAGTWAAGASTVDRLCGDGHVEFTTGENSSAKMAGLSHGDAGQHHSDIDFAVHLKATGRFGVYEAGVLVEGNFGTYLPGDLFRVENAGGIVTYSKNGAPFHTSTASPTTPLLVDTSLRTPGATIQDLVLTDLGGVCPPGAAVRIGQIDPPDMSPAGAQGIAFDGASGPIVIDGWGRSMWRLDEQTAEVLETFPLAPPETDTRALAFDGSDYFTHRGNIDLATVDPAAGAVVVVGALGTFPFLGFSVHPITGELWMLNDCADPECSAAQGAQLWTVDKATATSTLVRDFSELGIGQATALAITGDGTFYVATLSGGFASIWALDPVSGSATFVTDTGLGFMNHIAGLVIHPSSGQLYGIEEQRGVTPRTWNLVRL